MKPEIDIVSKQGPNNFGACIPLPSPNVITYFVFTVFIYFYCMSITFLHACFYIQCVCFQCYQSGVTDSLKQLSDAGNCLLLNKSSKYLYPISHLSRFSLLSWGRLLLCPPLSRWACCYIYFFSYKMVKFIFLPCINKINHLFMYGIRWSFHVKTI